MTTIINFYYQEEENLKHQKNMSTPLRGGELLLSEEGDEESSSLGKRQRDESLAAFVQPRSPADVGGGRGADEISPSRLDRRTNNLDLDKLTESEVLAVEALCSLRSSKGKNKTYHCDICNKGFSSNYGARYHMKHKVCQKPLGVKRNPPAPIWDHFHASPLPS